MKIEDIRLKICLVLLFSFQFYAQEKSIVPSIQPLDNLPVKSKAETELNPDYEKVLKEYQKLIEKYPDKKELLYNLGNLNYLNGDVETALQNYRNSLLEDDPLNQAHTLYNMGNVHYQMGDLQKSVELFQEALKLAPEDEDIRYNYELSKRLLEQQPPQQNQDEEPNQQNENEDENQQNQKQDQQSQNGEEQKQNSDELEKSSNEEQDNKQQQQSKKEGDEGQEQEEQSQPEEGEEKNEGQIQNQQSQSVEDKEKQLGKEEAEAILNALKADESNLKQKKYKARGRIKLEKDW